MTNRVLLTGVSADSINYRNNVYGSMANIPSSVRTMTEVEKAWLAGVIDGEGSIGLYTFKNEGRRVTVQVANTDRAFIEHTKAVIGCGHITPRDKENHPFGESHKGRKTVYHFNVHGNTRGVAVIRQILPYLIIKRGKAEAILDELIVHPIGRWKSYIRDRKERASQVQRLAWQNPETRANRIAALKKSAQTPEFRAVQSQKMTEYWKKKKQAREVVTEP